ncbi:Hint domain-containing protein [Roseovarius sp. D22-M7]|uniref:Hint domain-containing protein n=1 Tax=Roseovarius sp. D22-M7 TaxID=3127116 RepID=UPI00300FF239
MANFSVWMLEAGNITISGGQSLSGVTQGDGTHLVGQTLRLDNDDWHQTFLRDNETDKTFDDNDNSQVLDGKQTIDGVDYNEDARIEAEYRLTVRDPDSGDTWDVLGYNVNEPGQSPSYGTVEGLVFVGEFPPVGVDLEVVEAFEGPGDYGQSPIEASALAAPGPVTPPCFTPGTRILTDRGYVAVEDLLVGDGVRTRDAGVQRLCWVGEMALSAADLRARPEFQPVLIRADAFGAGRPMRDMLVSPQHRILVCNAMAELHFGITEVLVAAHHLIDSDWIVRAPQEDGVRYLHIMCDAHHVIRAEGLETETFLPGPQTLGAVPQATRDELLALFPGLRALDGIAFDPARPLLRGWEARLILPAHARAAGRGAIRGDGIQARSA